MLPQVQGPTIGLPPLPGSPAIGGFTLIEVMIAAGLASLLALAIMNLMSTMTTGQNRLNQIMNSQDLNLTVQTAIKDRAGCINSIQGTTLPSTGTGAVTPVTTPGEAFAKIKSSLGVTVLSTNPSTAPPDPQHLFGFGMSQLTVTQLTLSLPNMVAPSGASNPTIGVAGNYWLNVTFTEKVPGAAAPLPVTKFFPITIMPTASGPGAKVSSCAGNDQSASYFCGFFGGTLDSKTGNCTSLCLPDPANPSQVLCQTNFQQQICPVDPSHGQGVMIGVTKHGRPICGVSSTTMSPLPPDGPVLVPVATTPPGP